MYVRHGQRVRAVLVNGARHARGEELTSGAGREEKSESLRDEGFHDDWLKKRWGMVSC